MADPAFTAEQLAHIKAYAEPRYFGSLIQQGCDFAFDVLLLAVLVRPMYSGSVKLAAAVGGRLGWAANVPVLRVLVKMPRLLWGGDGAGAALAFIAISAVVQKLMDLPLQIYIGFFHEKAFGLSTESFGRFLYDDVKMTLLGIAAGGCLTFGVLGWARRMKNWWLLAGPIFGGLLLLGAALDPYRSQVIVDSHSLEAGPLRDGITALMTKAELPFGDIRVEETSKKSVKPDAYFAGQGPTRTIVLYDSLIAALTTEELLAAVAHEAGHAGESRWRAWLGSAVALFLFMALIEWLMRLTARRHWWGVTERADLRVLPLVMTVFAIVTFAFYPLSLHRHRSDELAADRYALTLTGKPAPFRQMLIKVARIALIDPEPPRWWVVMHMSHPPLGERLAAVDAWTPETPRAGEP
ncbi:MAG: M48 family metalloprotease [Myxococcaceae bacterium]